ncbi:MAG: ComEC family competence protein, partial [Syntrophaceae bacterium]|nr:ComEC family competence protein [Syntrophaceae bacterium]
MKAALNIGSTMRALLHQPDFIQERPLIPLFLCLACGILLCNLRLISWIVPALLMLPLAAGFFAALRLNKKLPALIIIYATTVLTGMLVMAPYISPPHAADQKPSSASREKVTYRGFVDDAPQPSRDRIEYTLSGVRPVNALKEEPLPGRVLLDAKVTDHFRYGDYIQFRARLTEPRNFNNPGGFDYREYLFRKGILQRATITHPADLILIRRGLGNPVKACIESYRDRLRNFVSQHTDSPEREILLAMILGEQKTIPDDLRERFNRTGTSHIIAISGFNVGLIAFYSFLFFMTALKIHPRLLLALNAPKVAYALSLIPIILYTVIAGMGTPVIRATLMVITLMTALMIGKKKDL